MEELSEIHKQGNSIIMVTHNPNLTTYADRVITMLDGKIDTDTSTPRERVTGANGKRPLNGTVKPKTKRKRKARKS